MKMAGSMRTESASSTLDGPNFAAAYHNGQRGAYSCPGLERSGSFRESLENRILVTGPSTSRNIASSSEILHLSLEPILMSEQKYSRSGELRRVLGVTVEEHPFGSAQSKPFPPIASEDLKRFKASIFESSTRARDRSKSFQESILKLDKYRSLLSRKRQRTDQTNEKSGTSNLFKMGNQIHQNPAELVSPRLEDRAKNVIPNRRIRSSMAEVRSEGRSIVPPRQGAIIDKDKNVLFDKDKSMLRGCNGGPIPSEDKMCGLAPGGDGWEKKLKRKRSVGLNRVTESDREIKQSIQQRPNNESRLRSSDGSGFRPALSSGTAVSNKMDSCSQLSGGNSRGTPKNDLDGSFIPNERREHSGGLDNERTVHKGSNKLNIREDVQAGNQNPLVKGKASRAPRSVSGAIMNASSSFLRSSGSIDGWEQAPCINKVQPLAATNRKRPSPNESSSPPVQWGRQRQKFSRTRRGNVVSPVSNLDEAQFLNEGFPTPDVGARMTTVDTSGLLISKGTANNAYQSKLKLDNVLSPAVLSESEESAAAENKFKEKGNDNFGLEDGVQTSPKATTFVLPPKKNKTSPKEEIGDGVRRQGRSGRGSVQSKASLPVPKEKIENVDTTKPLKNGKLGSERSESRIGRPPSKKMSERKACVRPQIMNSGSLELTGESDDDREELLAAANAARNASYHACSSSFWKKMEPFFAFVTLEEISYVKHQIHFAEELDASLSDRFEASHGLMGNVCDVTSPHSCFAGEQTNAVGPTNKSVGTLYSVGGTQDVETSVGRLKSKRWYDKMVPLSQRLLSAFIAEDDIEKLDNDTQGESVLQFSSDYVHFDTNNHVDDHVKDLMNMDCDFELDYKNQKNSLRDNIPSDGFMASNNLRHLNIQNFLSGDEPLVENSAILNTDNGSLSSCQQNNLNQMQIMDNTSPYECQFEDMSLDDRILMELHSIGLFPETVPDLAEGEDGEIDKVISELKTRLYQQVRKKKNQLDKMEKAIQDVKEIEERKLEQLAVNKLVEMAYKKLMGGRGSSGHKSGTTKVSKQLALAFGKRTLARCQRFEEIGQSCFREPPLRDVILSAPVHNIDAKHSDGSTATNYMESRSGQTGVRVSGGVTSIMMARHGLGNKNDHGPLSPYQGFPQISEQSVTKRKKEVLLDVVTGAASRAISIPTHTLPSSAKWKRTERDRDQNKDGLGRSSTAKAGRPSLNSGRGERKTKTKPKQKIAQLSTSGNGLGRVTETTNFMSPAFDTVNNSITKFDQEVELRSLSNMACDSSKEIDDSIFTNLPLHGIDSIDELDVAEGLGGQGQDIGSWLNVDDDALQDHDLVGLEIPMDDLSELKLNF